MGRDLAIDLGTANTLIYRQGDGVVFNEPSVVALDANTGDVVALGEEAWQAIGGTRGSVIAVRPMRHGVMTEYDITEKMVHAMLRRIGLTRFPRPRILVCVPSSSSPVERRAVEEAIARAGGRNVVLVEEPLAAAIGAHLPIHEPMGNLIVDIGGGNSEMAVVSMGGVVAGASVRVGGFHLDAAIQSHLRAEYNVAIGEKTAEELKIAIGSAFPLPQERAAIVPGRDLGTGSTVELEIDEREVRQAMGPPIGKIVEAARSILAAAPAELTHDVLETGIFLAGGGALLRGMDMLLAQECEVPVHMAEDPLQTVVRGAGLMLEHLSEYQSSFQLVRPR
ncbi:MAG: rod shape-determining protein [Actinomycetota bacterium]